MKYAHKYLSPASAFIKYRGRTGQIDRLDTCIAILSAKPGLTGSQVASLIYDKKSFPLSFGDIYKVLGTLCERGAVVRNGDFYYLTRDAISHDMATTVDVVDTLAQSGYDLTQLRFMSSAIIMAGEEARAIANGETYHSEHTEAMGVASAPEPEFDEDVDEEDSDQMLDDVEDSMIETELTVEMVNPFSSATESFRDEMRAEAVKAIAEEYLDEELDRQFKISEIEKAEKARKDAADRVKIMEIAKSGNLIGELVDINPGRLGGQVVGNVIEQRPSGLSFLVMHSADKNIEFGTVLNYEYAGGLTYKILFDFDLV